MKKTKKKLQGVPTKPDAVVSGLIDAALDCADRLFDASAISLVSHDAVKAGVLPEDVTTRQSNLYLIWVRCQRTNAQINWTPMYVGQRSQRDCGSRLNQHMFKTPDGTKSKLQHVQRLLELGYEFGISTALVHPDSARLSVEDEIIRNETLTGLLLPWNMKGRGTKRDKKALDANPEAWRPDRKQCVVGARLEGT